MRNTFKRAMLAIIRRPSRTFPTLVAIMLAAATVMIVIGISSASAAQTAMRFERMQVPTITVHLPYETWRESEHTLTKNLVRDPSVIHAGTFVSPEVTGVALTVGVPRWHTSITTNVAVTSYEGLLARGGRMIAGSVPSKTDVDPLQVMLGNRIAKDLGLTSAHLGQLLQVGNKTMAFAGIVEDAPEKLELATAVVVTPQTAVRMHWTGNNRTFIVRTDNRAVQSMASVVAQLIWPYHLEAVSVKAPADPAKLRQSLVGDAQNLTLIVSGVMVAVSIIGILNTMQLAVSERHRQIGISMALGFTPRQIVTQFLIEATLLGGIGAVIGFLFGGIVVMCVATFLSWPYTLPAHVLLIMPAGLLLGAVAGIVPAFRASRIDPAQLLRTL